MDLSDPTQLSAAFDAHHRSVYAAALRVTGDSVLAGDVVQDVFLRVWRRPQSFDPARGDLGTYLRMMARSRAIDLLRESQARARATDRFTVASADVPPREDARPDLEAVRNAERAFVREALGELPEAQREALVLAYWGGLTAEEIAERVRIPLGTAKSRIRLGLVKLRGELAAAA